ncbi:metabotropic glutamate receptor 5-like [Pantherophis guttatus]|uniref:Metabotropic glutamate receptor 5-like n=1 Tax=Pantherophis guttatus TaxID=94885 RepID=A0ABM3ZI10_PANGU|nr:metabotropic glutamate receptor 5-like [Pantherophis guttatus]
MDLLLLLLMLLVPQPVSGKLRMKCLLSLEHQDEKQPWSYYRPGDHLITMINTATEILHSTFPFNSPPSNPSHSRLSFGYSETLRFIFAIQVMNKNSQLLHNLTLGYNIHDNYFSTLRTSDVLLDTLSTGEANVPNYLCGRKDNLLALLDGASRDISIQMSTLVGIYKVPQISAEPVSEALSDKSKFPFFYLMLPKQGFQYPAIVPLLLHFKWTLIGLFASGTEEGVNFMRTFTPMLLQNGICAVISQQFSTTGHTAALREALSNWRQVNVFVHFVEYDSLWATILPFHLALRHLPGPIEGKVWILTVLGHFTIRRHKLLKFVHSIWAFGLQKKSEQIYNSFEPHLFLEPQVEDHYFHCSLSKPVFSVKGRRRCTQKAPLETQEKRDRMQIINYPHLYSIIRTLAQALNAAYSSRRRRRKEGEERLGALRLQPWQFHPFLAKNEFCNLSARKLYLDQNGDIAADLVIRSWVVLPKMDHIYQHPGTFKRGRLLINQDVLSRLKLHNKIRKNAPSVRMINIQMRTESTVSPKL